LLPCRGASAAEQEEKGAAYSLGEIVVSAERSGVEATQAVSAVTAEDIRSRGARTLDQAINLLPGVNMRVGAEGIPRIDVRGFRTRHVLLLLDGIPLSSAVDQQFDPTLIPTENIAEIKLTAGPSSVLYGQGGLGGVINIITKKGTSGLRGAIGAETGDHESYLVRGDVSGAKGKFDFFLSGSSTEVEAFPLAGGFQPTPAQGEGARENSDRRRHSALGNVGFTPTEELTVGLTVGYARGEFGKPSSVIRVLEGGTDPFANTTRYERVDEFENVSAQLGADYHPAGRLSLRGWAFLNRLEEQNNRYDNATFSSFDVPGSFRERIESTVAGLSLQPKLDLGGAGVVTSALSAEWNHWDGSGFLTAVPEPQSLDQDRSVYAYSAAVEYELSPLPRLGLVAGYGHHWQRRSGRSDGDFSVLAAAHYDLFADTRLKASFSRNVRFPSLGDLYEAGRGNPDLAAERAYTYQAGVEQKLPWESSASLNGFYTRVKNQIQRDQATNTNENLAETRLAGLELAAVTRALEQLLLRASYTYLHSEDRSREGRDQVQYTPGHRLTLEGKYDFTFGLSPYVSLAYVGSQYFYTRNNVQPVQKSKLADYALVNVKLSQALLGRKVSVYVGADNLFDQNYETSYGFPQAGRFVYGGAELRL
jgi:outer membrane receptor for ferrienterochelin and colicin